MAKKKRAVSSSEGGLLPETVYGIVAIVWVALAVFFMLSSFDRAGVVGSFVYTSLSYLFGVGYYLLPALAVLLAIVFVKAIHQSLFALPKIIGSLLFLFAGLGAIELAAPTKGGQIGTWILKPLVALFDTYASALVLLVLFLIAVTVLFEINFGMTWALIRERLFRSKDETFEDEDVELSSEELDMIGETEPEEAVEEPEAATDVENGNTKEDVEEEADGGGFFGFGKKQKAFGATLAAGETYTPPPLSLLEKERGKPRAGDVKANANIIKRTLANFGIEVEIEEVTIGPSVTQYAVKPAEGVRLSRILSLQNNLELALAAHPIRIEAPIPGKSLVGIEIPNSVKTTVDLASLLTSKEFSSFEKALSIALGRGVSGVAHVASISKMPHILVAGATGSGKSVTIHTIIASLLYRNSPDQLKFVLVDPKRVELTLYRDIPHLLTPVITDPKKAVLALKWLAREMERRYDLLQSHSVRDIESYHKNILGSAKRDGDEELDIMPFIVVVIDELADIMSSYPRELEAGIVRLAQMSRAVGIHLVLSTQRPSVNVITGLIKANIPARIALQVASQIDSRTIIDMAGAEKLLGAGDMLYVSGEMSKPVRLQSGFISEREVKRVADYLRKEYGDSTSDIELETNNELTAALDESLDDADDDELYEEARDMVIRAGKASTSYIQRKLRVGYARAARLMDILEERGVIGPADGAKPRDVLVSPTDSMTNADE